MEPLYFRMSQTPPMESETSKIGIDGVVETLQKLTNGFQKLPDPQLIQPSREWAVQNVSFETFTSQLTALLKSFY